MADQQIKPRRWKLSTDQHNVTHIFGPKVDVGIEVEVVEVVHSEDWQPEIGERVRIESGDYQGRIGTYHGSEGEGHRVYLARPSRSPIRLFFPVICDRVLPIPNPLRRRQ